MKYDLTIQEINAMHQHMINVYGMLEKATIEIQALSSEDERITAMEAINHARSELLDAERVLEQAMLNYDFANNIDMWS